MWCSVLADRMDTVSSLANGTDAGYAKPVKCGGPFNLCFATWRQGKE